MKKNDIYLTKKLEDELQNSLNKIIGHLQGIKKMLTEHKNCESLLIQTAAVKSAINRVILKLIEGHMETCVADCIKRGKGVEALNKLKGALSVTLKFRG